MSVPKLPFGKISFYFTGTLLLLLGLGVLNSIFLLHQIQKLQAEAKLINEVGIIRGSIQRIIKLELAMIPSMDLIRAIDKAILNFTQKQYTFQEDSPEAQFIQRLHSLESQWQRVKKQIIDYRNEASDVSRNNLIEVSEACWDMADDLVFAAQLLSETEVRNLYMALLLIGLNIITVLIVLWLNRTYVQNTLERLAHYDALTKLLNRYSYNKILENELIRAGRHHHPLALIIADIDHFKEINDSYGHKVGDQILAQLAALLREHVRQYDYVARIGGEEFAIIAPETTLGNAYQLAERLRQMVQHTRFPDILALTISFGVAEYHTDESQDDLFRRADQALYRAKTAGRNRVVTE